MQPAYRETGAVVCKRARLFLVCKKISFDVSVVDVLFTKRGDASRSSSLAEVATHANAQTGEWRRSPAGSVGKHDVAFLVCLFDERHTRLFLPVTHGLLEHRPLST